MKTRRGLPLLLNGLTLAAIAAEPAASSPPPLITPPAAEPSPTNQAIARESPADWYPELAPFEIGYLKVSNVHEIYYELCGNPHGIPVMVLHGGPGGGSYPSLRRYHDPARYLIVLHDQRGAGKSRPIRELKENNTPALVEDIEKLRAHLKLGRVQVFGGSWGSTLAVAYAEAYPGSVKSLVLRGVFLGTRAEIDHFYHGGAAKNFPESYARLQAVLPEPQQLAYPRQLLALLQDADPEVRRSAALAWATYEEKIANLEISDADVAAGIKQEDPYDFSLMENYYMAHDCFLTEGQLLQNAARLSGIPTVIVQGRYDVLCPPITAWKLHQALPKSRLVLVEQAGHAGGAPRMRAALVAAVKSLD